MESSSRMARGVAALVTGLMVAAPGAVACGNSMLEQADEPTRDIAGIVFLSPHLIALLAPIVMVIWNRAGRRPGLVALGAAVILSIGLAGLAESAWKLILTWPEGPEVAVLIPALIFGVTLSVSSWRRGRRALGVTGLIAGPLIVAGLALADLLAIETYVSDAHVLLLAVPLIALHAVVFAGACWLFSRPVRIPATPS